jgi:glutamate 5-kinase
LSDIDGLYTDDPNKNHDAKFVSLVEKIDDKLMGMGKDSSGSGVGTGGMSAKITAAQIANYSGADMVITNGNDVLNISRVMSGEDIGTLFLQHKNENVDVLSLV